MARKQNEKQRKGNSTTRSADSEPKKQPRGKVAKILGRLAWRLSCFVAVAVAWILLEYIAARLALVFSLALGQSGAAEAFKASQDSIVIISMGIMVTTLSAGVLIACKAIYRFIRDLLLDRERSLGKINEWLMGHTHPTRPLFDVETIEGNGGKSGKHKRD